MVKRTHGQTKEARARTQAKYNSKPEQIKNRSSRNKARRRMEKAGVVRKGDGKDIDHKDSNPRNNSKSNLQAQPKSVNRKDGGPPKKATSVAAKKKSKMVKALLKPKKRK